MNKTISTIFVKLKNKNRPTGMQEKKIRTVLISIYDKTGVDPLLEKINQQKCKILSTGGTLEFIRSRGYEATAVESLTGYPSILGGRVKTLHPKIFGGILARTANSADQAELEQYQIMPIDLVVVDLYPFEATVASGATEDEIIEKIDIGGISLIRAAAKNFTDVLIVSSKEQYSLLSEILDRGFSTLQERKYFAREAFAVSSHYDTQIWKYFGGTIDQHLRFSENQRKELRYGENPHQKGYFYGDLNQMFETICGKELSYNNILDIDAAIHLIDEFEQPTVAIIKHNNACGVASRQTIFDAWKDALAGDPVSAFGGIIISNKTIDLETAAEIDKIFYEVLIAPSFDPKAIELLSKKPKRIILKRKPAILPDWQVRTSLNGTLVQEKDRAMTTPTSWKVVTETSPTATEELDLLFANKIVKHTKSNTIVLAKNQQLIGSGTGQTSRVDALRQAIAKAQAFGFTTKGAVMASDAFFPFADSVEIAHQAGIRAVIQPGGSIKDQDSIDFCNKHQMSMIMTGIRHFKH